MGYKVIDATFHGYDGRVFEGFMLSHQNHLDPNEEEYPCSLRYKNILITGAKKMNLKQEYIERLENMPHYTPTQETLDARKELPDLSELPPISVVEVKAME